MTQNWGHYIMKYLTKRNTIYWYRRKIRAYGELYYSLKTTYYDIALLRHSYFNYKINHLVRNGAFQKMSRPDIKTMLNGYIQYMINEEYNEYAELRDKELATNIDGKFYGGHTQEAIQITLDKYMDIINSDDIDLVKAITNKILKRSNLQETYEQLETEAERNEFHWRLIKAEYGILSNAKNTQVERFGESQIFKKPAPQPIIYQQTTEDKKSITIAELTERYIAEQTARKEWSDTNERNIRYVLNHLSDWFADKPANDLTREDFSQFRDNVLKKLPANIKRKSLQNKSTAQMIAIAKREKIKLLGTTTINKHLRRVHQVFEWAYKVDLITKNLTKDLAIENKETKANKKAKTLPYTPIELKKLFEQSPWFTTQLRAQLKQNPQNIFIPLLSLWMGAKPTELAMLSTASIQKKDGIWFINFYEHLKNQNCIRQVPISDKLIEIGFLKFVKSQKKAGRKQLFPDMKRYSSGNTKFTNDFTIYNRKYISKDERKRFYSIRNIANQKLKNHQVPIYIINNILGHSEGSSNKDIVVYGDKNMPLDVLQKTINDYLVYDFLDFEHIKKNLRILY